MKKFLKKITFKNIAGVLGIVQVGIPLTRELLMVLVRICAVLIPGDKDDKIIGGVKNVFDKIDSGYTNIKNLFLK